MGILDTIKSQFSKADESGTVMKGLNELISSQGGVQSVMSSLQTQGLSASAPLMVDQIIRIFGQDRINMVANKIGMDPQTFVQKVTTLLPVVIAKLNPGGTVKAS